MGGPNYWHSSSFILYIISITGQFKMGKKSLSSLIWDLMFVPSSVGIGSDCHTDSAWLCVPPGTEQHPYAHMHKQYAEEFCEISIHCYLIYSEKQLHHAVNLIRVQENTDSCGNNQIKVCESDSWLSITKEVKMVESSCGHMHIATKCIPPLSKLGHEWKGVTLVNLK